jgi:2-keto-4-pentenoate hydratase
MMDAVANATAALLEARRSNRPAPLTVLPDADAAYAVQNAVAHALGWFDGVPRHWKSGGASLATQTHAPLPPQGVWASPADARAWPFTTARVIEAEVALQLARDVDAALAATLDLDAARALVDAMCVSIELCDTRWQDGFTAPALNRLADLQSHSALALGAWVPFTPARDWTSQPCRVQIGAQPAAEFRGTHSLGDPAAVLPAWLRHATRGGHTLPAGTVVTTGTWCGALTAQAGDAVEVTFDGIGQARVQL